MKLVRTVVLIAALSFCGMPEYQAQCPMCRMSVESNMKNGGTTGRGLNKGILYMLMMPYLLVGTMGFLWWKNQRREVDPDTREES